MDRERIERGERGQREGGRENMKGEYREGGQRVGKRGQRERLQRVRKRERREKTERERVREYTEREEERRTEREWTEREEERGQRVDNEEEQPDESSERLILSSYSGLSLVFWKISRLVGIAALKTGINLFGSICYPEM
ncbi:hypothetical protein scyTo_0017011 [Scyliorhinus torazame]|uniref:Uncharacterized protein n=1 Tax=Scyliorhinus torazame TaxID=75743 RepID=A0A401Q367_SCYTO|nr:hypothetical protein [Scyliorhinus torazame]